jgi:hypothetical protein
MTDDERDRMEFEESHPRNDRIKEAEIRVRFGQSWVRHQQIVVRLVRRQDVVAEYPMACRRVERQTRGGLRAQISA